MHELFLSEARLICFHAGDDVGWFVHGISLLISLMADCSLPVVVTY